LQLSWDKNKKKEIWKNTIVRYMPIIYPLIYLFLENERSLIQSESYNARSMRARRFLNKETVPAETTFFGSYSTN